MIYSRFIEVTLIEIEAYLNKYADLRVDRKELENRIIFTNCNNEILMAILRVNDYLFISKYDSCLKVEKFKETKIGENYEKFNKRYK